MIDLKQFLFKKKKRTDEVFKKARGQYKASQLSPPRTKQAQA
jgi:hypothetical protein